MPYLNGSIIQMIKNDGQIKSSVFALYLNNFTDNHHKSNPSSALEIGGYSIHKYSSNPEMLFFSPLVNTSND